MPRRKSYKKTGSDNWAGGSKTDCCFTLSRGFAPNRVNSCASSLRQLKTLLRLLSYTKSYSAIAQSNSEKRDPIDLNAELTPVFHDTIPQSPITSRLQFGDTFATCNTTKTHLRKNRDFGKMNERREEEQEPSFNMVSGYFARLQGPFVPIFPFHYKWLVDAFDSEVTAQYTIFTKS